MLSVLDRNCKNEFNHVYNNIVNAWLVSLTVLILVNIFIRMFPSVIIELIFIYNVSSLILLMWHITNLSMLITIVSIDTYYKFFENAQLTKKNENKSI